MEDFAKMIFENWLREIDYNVECFTDKGRQILDEAEQILSVDYVNRIYDLLCENGQETMENAFIAGFGYACKCLTNGKIDLKGCVFNE